MTPQDMIRKFSKPGLVEGVLANWNGSRRLNAVAAAAIAAALFVAPARAAGPEKATPLPAGAATLSADMPASACLVEFFDVRRDAAGRPVALLSDAAYENAAYLVAAEKLADPRHPVNVELRELGSKIEHLRGALETAPVLSDDFLRATVELEAARRQFEALADGIVQTYGEEGAKLLSSCTAKVRDLPEAELAKSNPTPLEIFRGAKGDPISEKEIDAWFARRPQPAVLAPAPAFGNANG